MNEKEQNWLKEAIERDLTWKTEKRKITKLCRLWTDDVLDNFLEENKRIINGFVVYSKDEFTEKIFRKIEKAFLNQFK